MQYNINTSSCQRFCIQNMQHIERTWMQRMPKYFNYKLALKRWDNLPRWGWAWHNSDASIDSLGLNLDKFGRNIWRPLSEVSAISWKEYICSLRWIIFYFVEFEMWEKLKILDSKCSVFLLFLKYMKIWINETWIFVWVLTFKFWIFLVWGITFNGLRLSFLS